MPKAWQFTENDDGTISNIQRAYSAEIESPLTGKPLIERIQESLELSDLYDALKLKGNAAKIARLEEQLAKREEAIARKDERIDVLRKKLEKKKVQAQKRLKELKA